MTLSNEALRCPERVVDLPAARTRHGDRVDLLLRMSQVGDTLWTAAAIPPGGGPGYVRTG